MRQRKWLSNIKKKCNLGIRIGNLNIFYQTSWSRWWIHHSTIKLLMTCRQGMKYFDWAMDQYTAKNPKTESYVNKHVYRQFKSQVWPLRCLLKLSITMMKINFWGWKGTNIFVKFVQAREVAYRFAKLWVIKTNSTGFLRDISLPWKKAINIKWIFSITFKFWSY